MDNNQLTKQEKLELKSLQSLTASKLDNEKANRLNTLFDQQMEHAREWTSDSSSAILKQCRPMLPVEEESDQVLASATNIRIPEQTVELNATLDILISQVSNARSNVSAIHRRLQRLSIELEGQDDDLWYTWQYLTPTEGAPEWKLKSEYRAATPELSAFITQVKSMLADIEIVVHDVRQKSEALRDIVRIKTTLE